MCHLALSRLPTFNTIFAIRVGSARSLRIWEFFIPTLARRFIFKQFFTSALILGVVAATPCLAETYVADNFQWGARVGTGYNAFDPSRSGFGMNLGTSWIWQPGTALQGIGHELIVEGFTSYFEKTQTSGTNENHILSQLNMAVVRYNFLMDYHPQYFGLYRIVGAGLLLGSFRFVDEEKTPGSATFNLENFRIDAGSLGNMFNVGFGYKLQSSLDVRLETFFNLLYTQSLSGRMPVYIVLSGILYL